MEFNVPFHYKYGYIRDEGAVRNNLKVHRGEKSYQTVSGYDCRKRFVLRLRRKSDSDEAVVMLSGRLFQSVGPAEVNDRSPTVIRRDGRTMI